ncbi:hypothetical protein POSPLADRAFT_1043724 [Postia placenta MAD-698-R-SB12]|uniref:Aminopeptidase n=1 Tax=Postia placenta MAD-698-R-SB12 TaxID=670580 RepID=A0A1X6NC89_9APHY|nr:hypothetical protein POSPLADRAFT_1043724 [Postia placenta MAD-698-R-SB12]OSX66267.1 hypothetical protein POSPLADRAFT_1043724 [Postia placenta MAD-698-R-SB12]
MTSVMHSAAQDQHRLPTNVKPVHYDLTVKTDLLKWSFEGLVRVQLQVIQETSQIVLNSREIQLENITIVSSTSDTDTEQRPSSVVLDAALERATFEFPVPLPANSTAVLSIHFSAPLTDSLAGYYRSAGDENTEVYAVTQFEPTAARRAFPCWDEPRFKATFAVTLISRIDTINISNMPAISETVLDPDTISDTSSIYSWLTSKLAHFFSRDAVRTDRWKITRFETSPPMSTYVLAYANGNFQYLESSYTSSLSGKTRPLRYVLDCTRLMVPKLEEAFGVEFPLPKIDTLVVYDFDAGAMENWGLIIGRTSAYLCDPKSPDMRLKKDIASMQCHELTHQWFGDITTMAWWDNLYLNEDWNCDALFLSNSFARALDLDAMRASHPIEVECLDASMAYQVFDALAYEKAATVLRMLCRFVGEEVFFKGVSVYLKRHLYGNTVTRDLWEGLESASGLNIPSMMDNWVKKVGYPVLTVTETQGAIHIRQDRFLQTGKLEPEDNETIWTVPLKLLTVSQQGDVNVNGSILLTEREITIPLDGAIQYKLNAGSASLCRVSYPPERLAKLADDAAKAQSIFSLQDRMGLVDDTLALAKAGYCTVGDALSLIDVLRDEKDYVVWQAIGNNLSTLLSVWYEDPEIGLFVPLVKRLGYENQSDDPVDICDLRTLAIEQTAVCQDPDVVNVLTGRFARYMETGDESTIPPDLRWIIYHTAVYHGGINEWEAVKKIAEISKDPSAGQAAIRAMGATQDPTLIEATLNYAFTGARDPDVPWYMVGLSQNSKARKLLASAFKDNFAALYERFTDNFTLQRMIKLPFERLSSEDDYEKTTRFFEDKDTSSYDLTLKQVLEGIASRVSWIKRSTDDIKLWFEDRKGDYCA